MMLNRFFRREPDLHTRSAEDQALIDGLRADNAAYLAEIANTGVELTTAKRHCQWADNQTRAALAERDAARAERDAARATLGQIAALETPACAHIGKKMAALAKAGVSGSAVEGVS